MDDLVERADYCHEQGLFDAVEAGKYVTYADLAAEIRSLRERVAKERAFRGALVLIATGGFKGDKCRQIAREALAIERHEDKELQT